MLNVCFNRKFESQLLFQQPVQVNELPHSSDQGQSGIPAVLCKTYLYFTLRRIIFLIPLNFPLELLSGGKKALSLCSLHCISSAHRGFFKHRGWMGMIRGVFLGRLIMERTPSSQRTRQ